MIARIIVAAAIFLVSAQAGLGQTSVSSTAQAPSAPPDEIATLSQQWMQAAQDHDANALERLMAATSHSYILRKTR